MSEQLYKVLGLEGEAINGGKGSWHRNGKWMPPIEGDLVPCEHGYHVCTREQVVGWIKTPCEVWEAEYRGERIDRDDKMVVREARLVRKVGALDEQTARLFAVDCAERVMHLGDEVVLSSVLAVVWRYAVGEVGRDNLAAARAAAWAAWAAAWAAAGAAAMAAAGAAAWAAGDAAWAARAAAGDAAGAAEREWQTDRLFEYLEAQDE